MRRAGRRKQGAGDDSSGGEAAVYSSGGEAAVYSSGGEAAVCA
jgi:hypothetical protein